MASSNDSSFGTILGIAALGFIAFLLWPRNTNPNAALQPGQNNNSLLAALLKGLMGSRGGGPGGGIAPLPMSGLGPGSSSVLGQFLGAVNNIGLTAADWYGASSSNGAGNNVSIPYQQTQQFDVSQLSTPITYDPSTMDPNYVDPNSLSTYDPSLNNISFDPTGGYTSMDGGGYSFGG